MHRQTVWVNKRPPKKSLFNQFHNTHIHSGMALAIVAVLSFSSLTFTSFFTTEVEVLNESLTFTVGKKHLHAASPTYSLNNFKGVDVMKYTKDVMRNQPSDTEIENIVSGIVSKLKPTHIAISIPLDSSEAYPNPKPAPRSAKAFTQKWADAIHSKGVKIIWRGTWSGIEGLYDFPKLDGLDRFPAGSAATAIADGQTSWLGKTYKYIIDNPNYFADGDVWAVMPERTEGIFQDSTSFLPHTSPGIQTNYANFFNDLKTVSDVAFGVVGKNVTTGWTANNFTEVKSNWLYNTVINIAGIISIDHYGTTHTVEEMESDLRFIYVQKKKQIFLQEWGDYWNQNLSSTDRLVYVQNMYNMLQRLANEKILAGFNYWGGWTGNSEGILIKNNDGTYTINDRGALLASFFANNTTESTVSPTLVPPPPAPIPSPTPSITPPPPLPPPPPTPTKERPIKETKNRSSGTSSGKTANTGTDSLNIVTPNPLPYKNGDLVNDNGTIYLVMGKKRLPFTNFDAFVGLGFAKRPILQGSTSMYQTPLTYKIEKASQQHPWGSWIIHKGTVYYTSEFGLLGVPSGEILTNNGGSFSQLVTANAADIMAITKEVMKLNDSRVIK